jgi:hypothetical protein
LAASKKRSRHPFPITTLKGFTVTMNIAGLKAIREFAKAWNASEPAEPEGKCPPRVCDCPCCTHNRLAGQVNARIESLIARRGEIEAGYKDQRISYDVVKALLAADHADHEEIVALHAQLAELAEENKDNPAFNVQGV